MTWPEPPDWIYAPRWYRVDLPKRRLIHPSFLVRILFGPQAALRLSWGAVQLGYPLPAYLLAHYLNMGYKGEPAHAMAARALHKITARKAIGAVWQAWLENRSAALERILLEHKNPLPNEPVEVRTYALLKLGHHRLLSRVTPEQIPVLVAACRDPDSQIAHQAIGTLKNLKNQESIAAFCRLWQESSTPLLNDILIHGRFTPSLPEARVYQALATNALKTISELGKDAVDPLIAALENHNSDIASRARFCLLNLNKMDAVNHFCARWYQDRRPILETCLLQAGYLAAGPPEVRVATMLKNNRLDLVQQIPPQTVIGLVTASEDPDPAIQELAGQAILHLQASDSQEALLEHLIAQEHPFAQEKALQAGYLPQSPENRARYLFLTGQWDAYEALDFDQRLLQAAYAAASAPLRKRIAQAVQRSGRVAYLKILTGFDQHLRRGKITAPNAEVLFRVLTTNQEWEQLWNLLPELPLDWSVRVPPVLAHNGWQPQSPGEQDLYNRLLQFTASLRHASQGVETGWLSRLVHRSLPPAVTRARLKVSGRANTVSFAPHRPRIAVGTGSRKVALWDYHHGDVERVYSGFDHSIGTATHTPTGALVVAEKTNRKSPCGVYSVENSDPVRIYRHSASITGLVASRTNDHILTSGRDRALVWYDLANRRVISTQSHHDWGRSVCVSPGESLVALLHKTISVFQLPDLRHLPLPIYSTTPMGQSGTPQKAAFLPSGDRLVVGAYNGQVAQYQVDREANKLVHAPFTAHPSTIAGCEVLPLHNTLITAGSDGELRFFDFAGQTPFASLRVAVDRLTSIQVSPEEQFLAIGSGDGTIALWDLRVLDLINHLSEPLSDYPPDILAVLPGLLELPALPPPVYQALQFLHLVLWHRFQFDIQIDRLTTIRPGEFDIIID